MWTAEHTHFDPMYKNDTCSSVNMLGWAGGETTIATIWIFTDLHQAYTVLKKLQQMQEENKYVNSNKQQKLE